MSDNIVTCVAPVNIAVIKYWGKRDEKLILPLNDSISTTLDTSELCATTTIVRSPDFVEDTLILNDKLVEDENPRMKRCLEEMRTRACDSPASQWKVAICSKNNFPTAAGLASSAAGYACLVYALAKLFGVEGDVSDIARQGSGSACRSLYGGFVRWARGERPDGADSVAQQLFLADHWPSLRILVLVVDDNRKKVSSTSGMQRSVETSELLQYRVKECVPKRAEAIKQAIAVKDFPSFAKIMMMDSNQFHATALDTYPPAVYMNDTSHAIAEMVHSYNEFYGVTKVGYTFDAGPNACLYMEETEVPKLAALISHVFPPSLHQQEQFMRGLPYSPQSLDKDLASKFRSHKPGLLRYCIQTKVGDGPKQLTEPRIHLLDANGRPTTPLQPDANHNRVREMIPRRS